MASPGPRTASSAFLALHVLIPVVIAVVGVSTVRTLLEITPDKCAVERNDLLPSCWLMAVGLVGLVAGRVFTQWDGPKPAPTGLTLSQWAVPLAWVLFSVALVFVWWFEAIGTAHVSFGAAAPLYEPITYYVRCAIVQDLKVNLDGLGLLSPAIVFVIGGLVGHWLWPWRALPKASVARAAHQPRKAT